MEKIMDLLCPGDWMDSYSSRLVNPNFECAGYPVNCMQDVFNVLRNFLSVASEYFSLFKTLEIYLDGKPVAEMTSDGTLEIYSPHTILVNDEIIIRYPFGCESIYTNIFNPQYIRK